MSAKRGKTQKERKREIKSWIEGVENSYGLSWKTAKERIRCFEEKKASLEKPFWMSMIETEEIDKKLVAAKKLLAWEKFTVGDQVSGVIDGDYVFGIVTKILGEEKNQLVINEVKFHRDVEKTNDRWGWEKKITVIPLWDQVKKKNRKISAHRLEIQNAQQVLDHDSFHDFGE